MRYNPSVRTAAALLVFAAACADLEVVNQNDADAERALRTAGDIESLVAGSYRQWWNTATSAGSFGPAFSNMAWQHSGWPANFGVVFYSGVPRVATINEPSDQYYGNVVQNWVNSYRSLAAVATGLKAIDQSADIQNELGEGPVRRARAYGKFVQGIAYGTLALVYDQAFIVDENLDVFDEAGNVIPQPLTDRQTILEASMTHFGEAISFAQDAFPDIPSSWMSVAVDTETLAQLAHSIRARFRAAAARTPEERAAVDWAAVLADIEQGVEEDWSMDVPRGGSPWTVGIYNQFFGAAWQQLSYQVAGMADQSGMYQAWLDIPVSDRLPDIDGEPFLIITPDLRFPQGATLEEQAANRGTLYDIPVSSSTGAPSLGNHFQQPARGTFRWSYYWAKTMRDWGAGDGTVPLVTTTEMDLLKAEAMYRLAGNTMTPDAAELVNRTRMAAGLDDISDGVNDSCVPKLPNGQCGGFFEALKWEKRFETIFSPGLLFAPWYFEGRGWGDLYQGTPLQLPTPCGELQLIPTTCHNFGGIGGDSGAPTSVYAWPHEG